MTVEPIHEMYLNLGFLRGPGVFPRVEPIHEMYLNKGCRPSGYASNGFKFCEYGRFIFTQTLLLSDKSCPRWRGIDCHGSCQRFLARGKISERQLRINSGNITPELREMADSVHAFGTKIIVQLHHGGFIAVPEYNGGVQSVAPSEYGGARALTLEEIEKIKQDFETSAKVAQTAGLDGVELHASHMYLLNQFMCPACNQRNDQYGGSLENRFRIVKEIIEEIRKECPAPFILGVRLGIEDLIPGGTTLEEGMQYAKWCEEAGAAMLNITTGFFSSVNNELKNLCRTYT